MLAYLVIREGSKWTDVFRLIPGQKITVGRAPTNQIVVKDERCSRTHAEIFQSDGHWTVRDLESRNGTSVGAQVIAGDYTLSPGDIIRIGRSQLAFVYDLSTAFPDSSSVLGPGVLTSGPASASGSVSVGDSNVLTAHEPAQITHRKNQTRYLDVPPNEDEGGISSIGRAAAKLCRLAYELAKAPNATVISEQALAGLFEGTNADGGAVLTMTRQLGPEPTAADLDIAASRTLSEGSYHRLSSFLATTVLREGEAVLARNIVDDSTLGGRDSKGEIHAASVICAPLRVGEIRLGLIHLYSSNPEAPLNPDDLEFTLAVADTLAVALNNLSRRQELAEDLNLARHENIELRERLGASSEIVGHSPGIVGITDQILRAATSKATVLIRGESGVGKELVSRAIHFNSPRRKSPFVCMNCAALSETLLESELFGHERGAFTGATERKIGKFEAAHQGTLMLDEIGEMSPNVQAKFLRVLEGHPFERVGGHTPVKVDVRVIAATNRDLERDVSEGHFRRDLYFRLRVLDIDVPPLRKRPDDITELAHHFLRKFNAETARKIRGFTPAAVEQMLKYRWPGNVRELRNVIERAVVLAPTDMIDADDLILSKIPTASDSEGGLGYSDINSYVPASLEEMETRHILATLRATNWNKSQAAQILGIERSTLDRKIQRYRLNETPLRSHD